MKKILSILSSAVLLALCVGCKPSNGPALPDTLSISPAAKNVISAGADIKVGIKANYDVTVTPGVDWVSVTMQRASCVLHVDENTSFERRSASILFRTSMGATATFQLVQFSAEADEVVVYPASIEFACEGGEQSVEVIANYAVGAKCSVDWLSVEGRDGRNFMISAAASESREPRTGKVVFTSEKGSSATLDVIQLPADYITLDKTAQSVSYEQGNLTVTADAYYEVSAESKVSWIGVEKGEGNSFVISYLANAQSAERSGVVEFTTELGATASFTLTQGAVDAISVTPATMDIDPDGGSFTVKVTSNYPYTPSCEASWVKVTPGANKDEYTITVDEHRQKDGRSASVVFTSQLGKTATVTVNQGGFWDEVTLSIDGVEATDNGARVSVSVTSNYAVSAASDVSWAHVSGSGKSFVVSVDRNNGASVRSGKVTFTSDHGASAAFSITQTPYTPGSGTNLPKIDIIDIDYD